ncbi:MAG TPA: hypothetical protein VH206_20055 [Xanthobacteraceae bacterium]|jgi:hypothetical protein|nr:hypothetical protein [Xanthobacteraceae bacterium]
MRLRVLDAERLGYAILEFDAALSEPSLTISIHSAAQQAYLGPDGQWQRTPHFFTARRIGGDDANTSHFQVGPDIVNSMMQDDQIEVATADKKIFAETIWENAAPEIAPRPAHKIYRAPVETESRQNLDVANWVADVESVRSRAPQPPGPAKPDIAAPPKPEPPAPQPPKPDAAVSPKPEPPAPQSPKPQPPAVQPPKPNAAVPPRPPRDEAITPSNRPIPSALPIRPVAPRQAAPSAAAVATSRRRPWVWAAAALGSLVILGAAVWLVPDLRCRFLGECPAPQNAEDTDFASAKICAEQQKTSAPCDVEACFARYFADFPSARSRPEVRQIVDAATSECRHRNDQAAATAKERDAAQTARACANQRQTGNRACEIQASCIAPYLAAFQNGTSRGELEERGRAAAATCEDRVFNDASSCSSITNACRLEEICFKPYLSAYPNGRYRDRVRSAIAQGRERCAAAAPPAAPPAPVERPRDAEYKLDFKASAECNQPADFGERLRVTSGRVFWQHDFRGVTYTWTGTIDANGNIQAIAPLSGTRATGHFSLPDEFIDLYYPQCGPIHGQIGGML